MKYRIYRVKNPGARKKLQQANKIGLPALQVLEDLDIAPTPYSFEQVFFGSMMEEPGAMAALSEPTLRTKAEAGDILVLKGTMISGAWILNRFTRSTAQLEDLPQFYNAVMGDHNPRQPTGLKSRPPKKPQQDLKERKFEEILDSCNDGEKAEQNHQKEVTPELIDSLTGILIRDDPRLNKIAKEQKYGKIKFEAPVPVPLPEGIETRVTVTDMMANFLLEGGTWDIYMLNGYLQHCCKLLKVGDGWCSVKVGNQKPKILLFSAISSIQKTVRKEEA